MSTKTKNYQFVKPEENEFYDINIPNANWDMADAELKRRVPEDGDISGTQVSTFGSITEEFPIPAAGDTTKTIVGKIKKFFEDFKNLKSSLLLVNQVVNNCTTDRGDLPGAAAQLKVLMDLYTKLNSDLGVKSYSRFTASPAEWLPSSSRGFSIQSVSISSTGEYEYAPPTVETKLQVAWWNVLTFGVASRCTQIAIYSFRASSNGGLIYIRRKHDDWVSDWELIL